MMHGSQIVSVSQLHTAYRRRVHACIITQQDDSPSNICAVQCRAITASNDAIKISIYFNYIWLLLN